MTDHIDCIIILLVILILYVITEEHGEMTDTAEWNPVQLMCASLVVITAVSTHGISLTRTGTEETILTDPRRNTTPQIQGGFFISKVLLVTMCGLRLRSCSFEQWIQLN
jgi:hypothetical protein